MADNVEYIISLRDKFSGTLSKMGAKMQGFKSNISSLNATMSGLFMGGALIGSVQSLTSAYNESEQAIAQVRQGLLSTGNSAGKTLDQLTKQASDLQKNTLFGDDEILKGATAQLLTFANVAGEQFDKAQKAILDVTTRLYGAEAGADSLKSVSIQVGKALNDPIANLSALSRSGIQFTQSQKDMIKSLWETGQKAQAQTLILAELEKQYGGSAEAAAQAGTGGMKQLSNQINDIQEKLGEQLMPIINTFTGYLKSLMAFMQRDATLFKTLFQIVANSLPIIAAFTAAFMLLNIVLNANPILLIVTAIVTAIGLIIGALITAWQKSELFRGSILGMWESMKQLYNNVKNTFLNLPDLIIEAFKAIPMAIMNTFKGIGAILKAVFTGDFKAIPDLLKQLGKDILKSNPITGIGVQIGKSLTNGIVDSFKEGYKKGKIIQKTGSKFAGISTGMLDENGNPIRGGATASSQKETKISSSAPRVFNINIDKLVENFTVSTQTLKEGTGEIKQAVLNALLGGLNDTQIVLNQ